MRSRASLDALRRHFRRFVKVRNTAGRLVFFRFWEPLMAQAYLSCATPEHPESLALLGQPDALLISAVVTCPALGNVHVHRCDASPANLTECTGMQLTTVQKRALARAAERKRRGEIARALRKGFPDETVGHENADLSHLVEDVVARVGSYGIRRVRNIHLVASWQLFYGRVFEMRDPQGTLLRICHAERNEETKVKQMQTRLSDLHRAGLL